MKRKVAEIIKETFVALDRDELRECSRLVNNAVIHQLNTHHKVLVKLSIFDDGTVLQEFSNGTSN